MAKLPEKIDKYQIEELIAEGGMGSVYKAVHPTLKRPVILKKLSLKGNPTITERFRREARILMDFRDDHIVDVQDHFVQGRSHYIVMEYVDGKSVKDLLDEERYLDNCSTAYIALHTARALRYAHSKGVVHRDIKPGNILISADGYVKLADFGIASSRDLEPEEETLTADGTMLGTPAYMAPEQFENSRTVDYRADLYSLGVMIYEMLTGLKPFPGGFSPETIRMIQKGRYRKPGKVIPTAAAGLQRIVKSLIKPNPSARCCNIELIIRKLEKWLERYNSGDVEQRVRALVAGEALPPVRRKRKSPGRRIIPVISGLLVIAAGAAALCSLTNIQLRLLFPDGYGQLSLLTTSDAPPEILLMDGTGLASVLPSGKIRFIKTGDGCRSLPAVLPSGSYMIRSEEDGRISWIAFTLPPWTETERTTVIGINPPAPVSREMLVTAEIRDAETGWDLEGAAVTEVNSSRKFIPLKDAGLIMSGGMLRFRISAPGYETREINIETAPGETALHLGVELQPENNKQGADE